MHSNYITVPHGRCSVLNFATWTLPESCTITVYDVLGRATDFLLWGELGVNGSTLKFNVFLAFSLVTFCAERDGAEI